MSNQPIATLFFYPDPFGTGEAITIEATDRQDADKQLKKLQDKREKTAETSQVVPQEAVEPEERTDR